MNFRVRIMRTLSTALQELRICRFIGFCWNLTEYYVASDDVIFRRTLQYDPQLQSVTIDSALNRDIFS
jgi:hypothetical protein